MNKERRDSIRLIIQNIEDAVSGLEEILEEEEQSRDNIPENLQNSAVYEKAEFHLRLMCLCWYHTPKRN